MGLIFTRRISEGLILPRPALFAPVTWFPCFCKMWKVTKYEDERRLFLESAWQNTWPDNMCSINVLALHSLLMCSRGRWSTLDPRLKIWSTPQSHSHTTLPSLAASPPPSNLQPQAWSEVLTWGCFLLLPQMSQERDLVLRVFIQILLFAMRSALFSHLFQTSRSLWPRPRAAGPGWRQEED